MSDSEALPSSLGRWQKTRRVSQADAEAAGGSVAALLKADGKRRCAKVTFGAQAPDYFHGAIDRNVAEARLKAAGQGFGMFLVREKYPGRESWAHTYVVRAEKDDGTLGSHWLVGTVRMQDCKLLQQVIDALLEHTQAVSRGEAADDGVYPMLLAPCDYRDSTVA